MAQKAPKPLKGKALDREIERLYGQIAQGRQINVLKIGSLFRSAADAYGRGVELEQAVKDAIGTYCEPLPSVAPMGGDQAV